MPPNDIESLVYTNNGSDIDNAQPDSISKIPLHGVYKTHIEILQGYITYRLDIDDPIKDNWTNITTQQINIYVCSNHWRVYRSTKIPKVIKAEISSSEQLKIIPATLNYGEPKETNVCIVLPDDPFIPDPYHTNLVTKTE